MAQLCNTPSASVAARGMTPAPEGLTHALAALAVRAWRLRLDVPPEVHFTIPMLRGVWGAALKELSETHYHSVFQGGESAMPRYLLRPCPGAAGESLAVDFVRFDRADPATDVLDWQAWSRAEGMGLGPRRLPFTLRSVIPLAWDETPLRPSREQPGFTLFPLPWALGDVAQPCLLEFPAPLRLIHGSQLIARPLLPDLTLAVLRRLRALAGPIAEPLWTRRADWLALARMIASGPWHGVPRNLVRYSGSQACEVEVRGVSGRLVLPEGPGPLAPLLMAATWLHLGKSTVMGLGQLRIHRD